MSSLQPLAFDDLAGKASGLGDSSEHSVQSCIFEKKLHCIDASLNLHWQYLSLQPKHL